MFKKIISIFLMAAIAIPIAGCTTSPSNEDAKQNANSSASQNAAPEIESEKTSMDQSEPAVSSESSDIAQVQLTVNGSSFTINLADNTTASAFAELLPMDVSLSELNDNEKYVYLDNALPSNASNPGTIEAGDVMLYGDDCIVVFYKSHPTSYSYTRIGKIADASGLVSALGAGNASASFTVSN